MGARSTTTGSCPTRTAAAVLDGILGADHAGFLSQRWASAFLDCCEALLGAQVDRDAQRVIHRGHVTSVGVHPLGVDAPALRERAHAADVQAGADALTELAGNRKIIVRVDRTELSKNILRGLAAYRELLATRPEWHGKVVHIAFAYPSRSSVPGYREYTEQVAASWRRRSTPSSPPRTGSRWCWRSRTTTRVPWPPAGWPTSWW